MNRLAFMGVAVFIGAFNTYGMEIKPDAGVSNNQEPKYQFKVTETYAHPGTFFAAISPDNKTLVSLADDKSVMIKSLAKLSTTIDHYPWALRQAVFSSDSSKIAIGLDREMLGSEENSQGFFVLDLKKNCAYQRCLKNDYCNFLMFTPDNNKIIAASNTTSSDAGHTIKIVNYDTGNIEHIVMADAQSYETPWDIEYSDLKVCSMKNSIFFALVSNGHSKRIDVNAYDNTLPDITYSQVKKTKLLEFMGAACRWMKIQKAVACQDRVAIVCQDPDARQYRKEFSNYHDFERAEKAMDSIRVHDINTGDIIATFSPYKDKLKETISIALSPNGKTLAFVARKDGDYRIGIADIETNNVIMSNSKLKDLIFSMTFSPDNRYILVIQHEGEVAVFDARTGENVSLISHIPAMGQFFDGGTKLCCVGTPYQIDKRVDTKKNEIIIAQRVATSTQNPHTTQSSCIIS